MINTTAFLKEEVDRYYDVRPRIVSLKCETDKSVSTPQELHMKEDITTDICSKPKSEQEVNTKNINHEDDKKSPLFGIFTKKSKKQDEQPKVMSEESIKNINDTNNFINTEVNKYHDARPVVFSVVRHEPVYEAIRDTISKSELLKTENSKVVDLQIEEQNDIQFSSHSKYCYRQYYA